MKIINVTFTENDFFTEENKAGFQCAAITPECTIFENCTFIKSTLYLDGQKHKIKFTNCKFLGHTSGSEVDDYYEFGNFTFENCKFKNMYFASANFSDKVTSCEFDECEFVEGYCKNKNHHLLNLQGNKFTNCDFIKHVD